MPPSGGCATGRESSLQGGFVRSQEARFEHRLNLPFGNPLKSPAGGGLKMFGLLGAGRNAIRHSDPKDR
jgi:hypothetical protein